MAPPPPPEERLEGLGVPVRILLLLACLAAPAAGQTVVRSRPEVKVASMTTGSLLAPFYTFCMKADGTGVEACGGSSSGGGIAYSTGSIIISTGPGAPSFVPARLSDGTVFYIGAKESGGNLDTIAAKDFATQTTLAAILAKILAAPATEAKQDAGNTSLSAIQTRLSGSQTVTPGSGTWSVAFTSGVLGAGTANIGDVDVLTLPALTAGSNQIGTVSGSSVVLQGSNGAMITATGNSINVNCTGGCAAGSGGATTVTPGTGTWSVAFTSGVIGAGSSIIGKVGIDQTTPGTTNKVADSDSLGQVQYNFPAGFVRTSDEPTQIFYDPFDAALDTTNRWVAPTSAGGGVAASVTAGVMSLGSGTTINGYSYLVSQPSFVPTVPAWLGNSWAIQIEAGATAGNNAVRFWGAGTVGGTPTSTNPLGATGNGYGFELDISGVLQAVVYSNGVRTVVASLATSQPTDGAYHRYIVYYRTDRIFWYVDSLATPAATSNFQSPQAQTLPLLALSVAHSAAPVASRVINCAGLAVWDTGKNNSTLSDGTFPWRKAAISSAGALSASLSTAAFAAGSSTSNVIATLGNTNGKVIVAKTGTLTSVAKTASQVVLSYTVPSTSTFYLQGGNLIALTTVAMQGNGVLELGASWWERGSGVAFSSYNWIVSTGTGRDPMHLPTMSEPIPVDGGTVLRCVVTPHTPMVTRWICNLIGYERPK